MAVLPMLLRHRTAKPHETAIRSGAEAVTWQELMDRIATATTTLRRRGLQRGNRIAIEQSDPLSTLVWFLAADASDLSALIMEPTWAVPERAQILAIVQPSQVIQEPAPTMATGVPELAQATPSSGEGLFYLGTTSGSSALPKVYTRTRDSWRQSFTPLNKLIDSAEDDVVLVAGSLSSSLFLFSALQALAAGSAVVLANPWSPERAAHYCQQATVMHLVPAMLAALCDLWEINPQARRNCTLRVILCCGAILSKSLEQRLHRLLPGCRLIEYFGSSEHSLISVRTEENPATVGRPITEVEVEIRDEQGITQSANSEGLIWIRSPLVFEGYVTKTGITKDIFDQAGWLSNGDRGLLRDDGTLELRGRAGQLVINTGGHQVSAAEVESVLREMPEISDVVVFGVPHSRLGSLISAVIEPRPGTEITLATVRAQVSTRLSPAKRPRRWWTVTALPRTTSGKASRVTETILASPLVRLR